VFFERKETHTSTSGRKNLSSLQEVACGGLDWIDLAQVRDRCRAIVNLVMNLRVP